MQNAQDPKPVLKNRRLLIPGLCFAALLMFGFSFALVPLYNVFCQVTGLNGKVDTKNPGTFALYKSDDMQKNANARHVVVEFDTNRNQSVACEFSPSNPALNVIPGELTHTTYHVKNLTQKKMIVQAIPSITPGTAAKYLKKLECFCFNQQILKPGESLLLPLRFWLEPEIPDEVHRLTLSYTLFDVTELVKENGT